MNVRSRREAAMRAALTDRNVPCEVPCEVTYEVTYEVTNEAPDEVRIRAPANASGRAIPRGAAARTAPGLRR